MNTTIASNPFKDDIAMRSFITLTSIALITITTALTASASPNNPGANCSNAGKALAACVIEQSQSGGQ